jgi:hypothetical protein
MEVVKMSDKPFEPLKMAPMKFDCHDNTYFIYKDEEQYDTVEAATAHDAIEKWEGENPFKVVNIRNYLGLTILDGHIVAVEDFTKLDESVKAESEAQVSQQEVAKEGSTETPPPESKQAEEAVVPPADSSNAQSLEEGAE